MTRSRQAAGSGQPRRDRLLRERVHDTYKSRTRLPEPTVCPQCGAVFHKGRWQWLPRPDEAEETLCPACSRTRDNYPAGYVYLTGQFIRDHKEELLHLARNVEAREKADHPMNRIMAVEEQAEGLVITATDMHLARAIGMALSRAYEGELDFAYPEEGSILRVHWSR